MKIHHCSFGTIGKILGNNIAINASVIKSIPSCSEIVTDFLSGFCEMLIISWFTQLLLLQQCPLCYDPRNLKLSRSVDGRSSRTVVPNLFRLAGASGCCCLSRVGDP
ncbi:hypothetical protein KIL84_021899 [Mauremys mutica]|uniref:Uncharacterized protein n=1 Tax=Mauremys mutica TaxID=74926 RepID=A0A9D3XGQ3_9SAUR|nr:hypothetical protein KIL84_021899 [Mauremys mutica]